MRHIFRTVAGKTFLFLVCILSTCTLILGVAGVVIFGEEGIYTLPKENLYQEYITNQVINDWIYRYEIESAEVDEDNARIYTSNTNLILTVKDENGNIIGRTKDAEQYVKDPYSFQLNIELSDYTDDYGWNGAYVKSVHVYYDGDSRYTASYMRPIYSDLAKEYDNVTLIAEFRAGLPVYDTYRLRFKVVDTAYSLRTLIFPICLFLGLLSICSFVGLMSVSGRRRGDEELHPGPLTVVPFDIVILALLFAGGMSIAILAALDTDFMRIVLLIIGGPALLALLIGCCMSLAVRIKGHILISGLFITKVLKFCWKVLCFIGRGIKKFVIALPLSWKALLVLFADFVINAIAFAFGVGREPEFGLFLLVIKSIAAAVFAAYMASKINRLQVGAKALAEGNLAYRIDSTGMLTGLKEHAEMLNSISQGMGAAVEQRMKSERMKTELITNVSHDIKTPLTSIINYAGLIANEECDNAKHAEYTEVLVRQSKKLKRLIEDLVEASKASTGNLEVHPSPCDASVLLSQVSGEYEERLRDAGLTLVVKQPEEQLTIMADGRHMWRIFDNLMNNICKYSLTGSRVYLTLERNYDMAQFVFKNTSKEVLDISEEELMERFVRGDSSRNTEGNGLGLSIAKSLAQLQNGWLRIETDGDLFKAILTFPLVGSVREPEYHDESSFPRLFDDIFDRIRSRRADSQVIYDNNGYPAMNNDPVINSYPVMDDPATNEDPTTDDHASTGDRLTAGMNTIAPQMTDDIRNTEPDSIKD